MTEQTATMSENQTNEQADGEIKEDTNLQRFLTFVSDDLIFGVSSDKVIEIINNHKIRSIPMVPNYVMGVINLRGQIIPIIDTRIRMGKPFREYDSRTCIIILNINSNIIGIVVDSVSQVIDIDLNKSSSIPVENKQRLTNSMVSIEKDTVVLLLECEELIESAM